MSDGRGEVNRERRDDTFTRGRQKLPGSPGACKDAWGGILKWQLDNRHRPCNFVEIMPRLTER